MGSTSGRGVERGQDEGEEIVTVFNFKFQVR